VKGKRDAAAEALQRHKPHSADVLLPENPLVVRYSAKI
jgi:hypothetical protein